LIRAEGKECKIRNVKNWRAGTMKEKLCLEGPVQDGGGDRQKEHVKEGRRRYRILRALGASGRNRGRGEGGGRECVR